MIRSVLLALVLLSAGGTAHAQMLPGTDPVSLIVSPQYPRPYQSFTVSPQSTLIDLSASTVRISVNGTEIYEGSGTRGATARAGGLGERTTITLTVIDPAGRTYTRQQVIRPAEVSLVLEPQSTAHPFYRGGGLVASEGRVRLVALADFRNAASARIAPQNLVYTWRLGNQILTDSSGI